MTCMVSRSGTGALTPLKSSGSSVQPGTSLNALFIPYLLHQRKEPRSGFLLHDAQLL
jgi:hypothetical protein